jgi:hypothetical protein
MYENVITCHTDRLTGTRRVSYAPTALLLLLLLLIIAHHLQGQRRQDKLHASSRIFTRPVRQPSLKTTDKQVRPWGVTTLSTQAAWLWAAATTEGDASWL